MEERNNNLGNKGNKSENTESDNNSPPPTPPASNGIEKTADIETDED